MGIIKVFESISDIETDYLKVIYYDLDANCSGDYKTYNYTRLCAILDGEKTITLDSNEKFKYGNDKFLLLPPNSNVHMNIIRKTKAVVFELNDELIKNVLKKTNIVKQLDYEFDLQNKYFLGFNKNNISKDIQDIFEAGKKNDINQRFLIDLYAQKLIFDLAQEKATHDILNFNNSHPITIALKYINDNLNGSLSVKNISDYLHMSESNFSHMFKKIVGCNPSKYIREKKMELAKKYLRNENVTEVAYDLGYDNISYFIRLFKAKYKLTPKQYQKCF